MKAALWTVGILLFVTGGLVWYKGYMLERNVDFLFDEVLASGNVEGAYQNGDPVFQAIYAREVFVKFAEHNPDLFRRPNVSALEVVWQKQRNDLYVVLRTQVQSGAGGSAVEYYCRPADRNRWRLVGIVPGLDAAIPKNLAPANP